MTEEEWLARYEAMFVVSAGMTPEQAHQYRVNDGRPFSELSEGFEDSPEDAAEEEMSYWEP